MKAIFDYLRKISGGKLTQKQVDAADKLISFSANAVSDMLGMDLDGGMKTSKNGTNLISTFEGFYSNAYLCPAGVWTIGIGTTIYPNGTKVKQGDKCTMTQAVEYLSHDLQSFERTVNQAVTVSLSQNQFDALVSLAYNIGSNAFEDSTLVKYLNAGKYKSAAEEFLVWNKGGGKVLKGLVNRRAVERELFLKK